MLARWLKKLTWGLARWGIFWWAVSVATDTPFLAVGLGDSWRWWAATGLMIVAFLIARWQEKSEGEAN